MIERYATGLIALGLVAAHDPGDMAPDADLSGGFGAYRLLVARGALPIRVHASIRTPALDRAIGAGSARAPPSARILTAGHGWAG